MASHANGVSQGMLVTKGCLKCVLHLPTLDWVCLVVHDRRGKFCSPLFLGNNDCCFKNFDCNSNAVMVVLAGGRVGGMVGLVLGITKWKKLSSAEVEPRPSF
eukprot:15331805-Ditylum_brightwellii.AAC.1